jgi:hypothetical protein
MLPVRLGPPVAPPCNALQTQRTQPALCPLLKLITARPHTALFFVTVLSLAQLYRSVCYHQTTFASQPIVLVHTTKSDNPASHCSSTRLPQPRLVKRCAIRIETPRRPAALNYSASTYTSGHHLISLLRRVVLLLPRDLPQQPCGYEPSFQLH